MTPSTAAVIVALPTPAPVIIPLPSTVAMLAALELHVTPRPLSELPAASLGVATSVTVCPDTSDAFDELSVTVATGTTTAATVIVALPASPSLVAVITALPTPAAVTTPDVLTVATVEALVVHAMARPDNAVPDASLGVATSVTD